MTLNETNHSKQSNRQRLLSVYFYQFISAQSRLLKLIAMSTRFSAESSQAPSRTHTPIGSNDADLFYFPPPIKFQVTDPDDHVTETCPPSAYDVTRQVRVTSKIANGHDATQKPLSNMVTKAHAKQRKCHGN